MAANWEGGVDNATALELQLDNPPVLDSDNQILAAWVDQQPRIWETMPIAQYTRSRASQPSVAPAPAAEKEPPGKTAASLPQAQQSSATRADRPRSPRTRPEQVPLIIEHGDVSGNKPCVAAHGTRAFGAL